MPASLNLFSFYRSAWVEPELASLWMSELSATLPWTQPSILIFGRRVPVPRCQVWMGDADASYRYSGLDNRPEPWSQRVLEIRQRLEQTCGRRFNSVLINLYRDGRDSNGWHSDDEPELGEEPFIASLSLGASRRFLMRARDDHSCKVEQVLEHGSLLVRGGRTQALWQHCIPKQMRVDKPRLNLTFRWVASSKLATLGHVGPRKGL